LLAYRRLTDPALAQRVAWPGSGKPG
jgi:hypothetical protein